MKKPAVIRAIFHDFGWKLLSLFAATLLWYSLVGEQEMATSVSAPIEFKNIPRDLEISSDIPERIRLEILTLGTDRFWPGAAVSAYARKLPSRAQMRPERPPNRLRRLGGRDQISVCSEISKASSTSMPR